MEATPERDRAASTPERRPDLYRVDVDGEAVLYDPAAGSVHRLNPVAAAVLGLLDGRRTVAEAASRLAAETGLDGTRVRSGVLRLVEDLARRGLLTVTEPPPRGLPGPPRAAVQTPAGGLRVEAPLPDG